MGDRAQVAIENHDGDGFVYLYTHWNGSELAATVRAALARRLRWNDREYLTRIIFCEMIKGCEAEENGFGIGTEEHGDNEHPLIVLDCDNQKITVGHLTMSFETFLKTGD